MLKDILKKIWDYLFKIDYTDFLLDGKSCDLTQEEIDRLKKKIENM